MEDKVKTIISNYQGIDKSKIKLESRLIQDLGLSSFDIISLVCEFENEFNIQIPDRNATNVRTIQDIVNEIEKLLKEGENI